MKEISFDFNGHRYGVRVNQSSKVVSYFCDYRPISVLAFRDVIALSQHDTSNWRRMLGLK